MDPDQTLQNAVSDQGLHCLLTGISLKNRTKIKKKHQPPLTQKMDSSNWYGWNSPLGKYGLKTSKFNSQIILGSRPLYGSSFQTDWRSSLISVYTICHSFCIFSAYYRTVKAHSSDSIIPGDPFFLRYFELPYDETNKMACAPSKDSDQPGHPPSLISLCCLHEESSGP